jgi:hypothetical protein
MQLKLAEEASRPSEIARREAQKDQAEQDKVEQCTEERLVVIARAMDRASADRPQANAIGRKALADFKQQIDKCRTRQSILALPPLLDKIEADLPAVLATLASAVRVVAERARDAEIAQEKENARLSAAGMTAIHIIDWLERERFVLKLKGDQIFIANIDAVGLAQRAAIQMHHAAIVAILKGRQNFGPIENVLEG